MSTFLSELRRLASGETPDGAPVVSFHGIQVGGPGGRVVASESAVHLVQARGILHWIVVAVTVPVGAAAVVLLHDIPVVSLLFGVLFIGLPLLALLFFRSFTVTATDVVEVRRNPLRPRRTLHYPRTRPADGREAGVFLREQHRQDSRPTVQVLIRVNDGWLVLAETAPASARRLAAQLHALG